MILCPCSHLNPLITTLSVSVTVLHQRRSHGWSERRVCSSGASTTSTWLVSCVGVYCCFPALLGNILVFQHRPVQRATQQKEPEEEQLNGAKVRDLQDWRFFCVRKASVRPRGTSALNVSRILLVPSCPQCKYHKCRATISRIID